MPANDTQVGGDHYRKKTIQHWDFAIALRLPYLEGVATKYIDRFRDKAGRQDLEKAIHYLQKIHEEAHAGRIGPRQFVSLADQRNAQLFLDKFFANRGDLNELQRSALRYIVFWETSSDIRIAASLVRELIEAEYPDASPGPQPDTPVR